MTVEEQTNAPDGSPARLFASKADWARWLSRNHQTSAGLWLRLAKKDSGLRSVSYKEALDVALCYGWIDGQKRAESEQAWLQRFLPRSSRSIWSKINRERRWRFDGKRRDEGRGAGGDRAGQGEWTLGCGL